jgi:hypothetical protein
VNRAAVPLTDGILAAPPAAPLRSKFQISIFSKCGLEGGGVGGVEGGGGEVDWTFLRFFSHTIQEGIKVKHM